LERVVRGVGPVLLSGPDPPGPERAPKTVSLGGVRLVEGPRLRAVKIAHPRREVRELGLDQQVVVVAEETARVQPPAVAPTDALQDSDEDRAVSIVHEDWRVVVPLRADVVVRAGLGKAKRSSHPPTVPPSRPAESSRAPLDT